MEKSDFFYFIKDAIMASNFIKPKIKEIEDFLLGITDDIKLDEKTTNLRYNYSIFHGIDKALKSDSEDKEIAKRALEFMFKCYPENILNFYIWDSNRYEIYNSADLKEKFIIEAIKYDSNNYVKSYSLSLEKKLLDCISSIKTESYKNSGLAQAFLYYENFIEFLALKTPSDNTKEKMTQFILRILCVEKYKNNKEKSEKYLKLVENDICSIVKKLNYNNDTFSMFSKDLISDEFRNFYSSIKESDLFYDRKILENLVIIVCKVLCNKSNFILEALRICIANKSRKEYLNEINDNTEELDNLYKKLNMMVNFNIDLYCEKMISESFQSNYKKYFDKLQTYFENNKKELLENLENYKNNKNIKYIVLLAFLLKNKDINIKNDIETAEDILVKKLKNLYKNDLKTSFVGFQIKYNDKIFDDFKQIKDKNFNILNAEIICNQWIYNSVEIINCSAFLFDYSILAKNLVCIFIQSKAYKNQGSNFNIFEKAQEIFSDNKTKNKYQLISNYLKPLKVINAVIFYNDNLFNYKDFCEFLKSHLEEAKEEFNILLKNNNEIITYYIDILYKYDIGFDYKIIIPAIEHKKKMVVNYIEDFLIDKKELRKYIEPYANSKNKNTKDAVSRILRLWDYDKITSNLKGAKNMEELTNYISQEYNAKNDKIIPYKNSIDLKNIRLKNSEKKAPEIIIKYYITEYMMLKNLFILEPCNIILEFLNKDDLKKLLKNIYDLWIEDNSDTKKKNLLLPYALSCNEQDIVDFKKQIDIWTENSRGALAAFAVKCMAMNGNNIALILTQSISNKYKNKQVKRAASEAMEELADTLKITKDELEDKIIPDLGFNKSKEKTLDYGSRKFKAILNNKLEISIIDEKDKIIKSLPKPNSEDNKEMAEACKNELKSLKKQLKTIVSTQKTRLETALITGRKWDTEKWNSLFVNNPIMHMFAIGLIWKEEDKNKNIIGTFRYMEDGSFNTLDEEEYTFQKDTFISLLHPLDITKEDIENWKEQLEDYEIIQPLEQLSIPVYSITEEEKEEKYISRFNNKNVYFGTIKGVCEKYDWKRTSIQDAGGYEGYYYENSNSNIGVQIIFDYIYVGMAANDTAYMRKIEFYKKGSMDYGSYCYDEITDNNRVLPKDVPKKLLSFAIMIGDLIAQKEIK